MSDFGLLLERLREDQNLKPDDVLDAADHIEEMAAALRVAERALCSDPPAGFPQKHVVGDDTVYYLDGQKCGRALQTIRNALQSA